MTEDQIGVIFVFLFTALVYIGTPIIAESRGRRWKLWLFLVFFFPLISTIILLLLPRISVNEEVSGREVQKTVIKPTSKRKPRSAAMSKETNEKSSSGLKFSELDSLFPAMARIIKKTDDESEARAYMDEVLNEFVRASGLGEWWALVDVKYFMEIIDYLFSIPEVIDPLNQEYPPNLSAGVAVQYAIEQALDGRDDLTVEYKEGVLSKMG